jgi:hypothetical protein
MFEQITTFPYRLLSFGFLNSFHNRNTVTATTTPAMPEITTPRGTEPNIHFKKSEKNRPYDKSRQIGNNVQTRFSH